MKNREAKIEKVAARHDLRDVTFIVPIFLDTPERLRNLQQNVRFLTSLFETQILIGEHKSPEVAPVSQQLEEFGERFEYLEFPGAKDNFFRTRLLNQLLARVQTPLVCNLDCDAFFSSRQYLMSAQLLRWDAAEFVLPYDSATIHIAPQAQDGVLRILQSRPLDESEIARLAELVWNGDSVGGAIFGKTPIYRDCGGENEKFLGWGWEDFERLSRFQKLGLRVSRTPGNFHHFTHPRGATSSELHAHYEANWNEYQRIEKTTRAQLECEIKNWNWAR